MRIRCAPVPCALSGASLTLRVVHAGERERLWLYRTDAVITYQDLILAEAGRCHPRTSYPETDHDGRAQTQSSGYRY